MEPPVEDVVPGLRLRPLVAFCASLCMQLPLLLGSLLQPHHQYRLGGATVDAPGDTSTVNTHGGGRLSAADGRFPLGGLGFSRSWETSFRFVSFDLSQLPCGKGGYCDNVGIDGMIDWHVVYPRGENCTTVMLYVRRFPPGGESLEAEREGPCFSESFGASTEISPSQNQRVAVQSVFWIHLIECEQIVATM